jgi:alkaline phosphatase D
MTRRDLFLSALALASTNPLPLRSQTKLNGYPFTLGIASGEPLPDGAVLWTRLAPKPLEGGGMPNVNVEVNWTVAEDDKLEKIVRSGKSVAAPSLAHSVHVEVAGLDPERWYWYRFEAAGERSAAGRFRTAAKRGSTPSKLRMAFASCQQWTQGLYTAYQHMAEEDVDLVLHLGDYIYEQGYRGTVRPEGREETFTLADYRNRHALYKTDPLLQAAHARFPWVVTWDDHEVSNNYADEIQEKGQPREEFLKRRAWAYQVFYEHMPLRKPAIPKGPDMLLYRRYDYGDLMRLCMLDTRQYRSDQPCSDGSKPVCADMDNPKQTLLGARQEKWLEGELRSSKATWNVLGQQILVTFQDFDPGPGDTVNMDSWSGYPLARNRLVESLRSSKAQNPVVLTGDVHASWVGQVHTDSRDVKSPCVAAEFVGTSISSGGDGADTTERAERMRTVNPQIRYFNARRGYVRCELSPEKWRTDYRLLEYVTKPGSPIATKASFVLERGNSVPQSA